MSSHPIALMIVLVLVLALPARATIIDSFETGPFSLSINSEGSVEDTQAPGLANCIADQRWVRLDYSTSNTGTMTCSLNPVQNVDDALVTTFPTTGNAPLWIRYEGGPWDLTGDDRFSIGLAGSGFNLTLNLWVWDEEGNLDATVRVVNAAGTQHIEYSELPNLVRWDRVTAIELALIASGSQTWGIRSFETTREVEYALAWDVLDDLIYVVPGLPPIGPTWGWLVPYDGQIPLLGSQLYLEGFASNYDGLRIEGFDSGGEIGAYGESTILNVFWEASSFQGASFQMDLLSHEDATYGAQRIGGPSVQATPEGIVIGHDLLLHGMQSLPDGLFQQDVVVFPGANQDLQFENVQVFPIGPRGTQAGYTLLFDVTGSNVDVNVPLFEAHLSGDYIPGFTVTGVTPPSEPAAGIELTARPTVTRTVSNLVLSHPAQHAGTIDVFNVGGRIVRQLPIAVGGTTIPWDGRDQAGRMVASGVYLARYGEIGGQATTTRVVRLR